MAEGWVRGIGADGTQRCIHKLSVPAAHVAQSCTLPQHRFAICRAPAVRRARQHPTLSQLQVGATAECNSALPRSAG